MKALLVLFGGWLSPDAFEPLVDGKNSLDLALERSRAFPGVEKTLLLSGAAHSIPALPAGVEIEQRDSWTKKSALETLAARAAGFDIVYFAWADCPFLDPDIAAALAERCRRYVAEYAYADGWPYGIAPELITPSAAAVLAKIAEEDDSPVERDMLFSVIQKDINNFDIETEIAPVDLRCHRLSFCADSKRNLLLLRRFVEAGGGVIPAAAGAGRIISEQPVFLRTLPAFFPVQVYGGCPQSCAICPYPAVCETPVVDRRDFMDAEKFDSLLEKIIDFSGDAVIDLSLWGELALHPQKLTLVEKVLARPGLALVIETSGIGWKDDELAQCAALAHNAKIARNGAAGAANGRENRLPPLSWIVSLDAADGERYRELRGAGFAEAVDCAKKLFALFPKDSYVQAVRTAGAEDAIEKFYRSWKEIAPGGTANIIIQKYDDFCGMLERRQASDLSPVVRQPCWHLMRDMPVMLDGTVPQCRERFCTNKDESAALGNIFSESLETIWERGNRLYLAHCEKKYGFCMDCDEYYTYNF